MPVQTETARPFVFIVNPVAGPRLKVSIADLLAREFPDSTEFIYTTRFRGHARKIAKQRIREGFQTLVAVGGDGTVNEVASALVDKPARLGIIPTGSGNGLARSLGIPLHFQEALDVLKSGTDKRIDAGKVNKRYFFCTCGTGFDAMVGRQFNSERHRGWFTYIRATFWRFFSYRPKVYSLRANHRKIKIRAFQITFANAGQYGNNAYIAPQAVMDDGLLDMCIVRPFPKVSTLSLGIRLFFRNIDQSRYLEVIRVKKAMVKRQGKKRIRLHADGEPLRSKKRMEVSVLKRALIVIAPEEKPD